MPILLGGGGFGDGGFTLGPAQNVFTGADRAAAESARDIYATANPSWLTTYNGDTSLNIRLEYTASGENVALYQVRNTAGDAWLDNSSAIGVRGSSGPAGATGNSYFFSSEIQRDSFFGNNSNSLLLESGLPITVNRGNIITSYYWTGDNFPPSYDSSLFNLSLVGTNAYNILEASDLEKVQGYSGGVITIPDGVSITLIVTTSFLSSPVSFVLQGNSELRLTTQLANCVWNYTGTGTFLSGEGVRASIDNIVLFSSDTSKFIETKGLTLNLNETAIAAFNQLGKMEGTGFSSFGTNTSFISQFDSGLELENMNASVNSLILTSATLNGDAIIVNNPAPFPLILTFDGVGTQLRSLNNVYNINPSASRNVSVQIKSTNTAGEEGLFNNSEGLSGTFTSVSDGSVSIGIDSVQDNGDGRTRFNLSTSPDSVFVGEIVNISGYTTNTSYNGAFIVQDVPSAGTFVVDTSFGTNEAGGNVSADVVTITDMSTILNNGDTLTLSTNDFLTYDGGATVFNKQLNTFQVNRTFNGTASGTWSTNNLDQSAINVLSSGNIGFMDSTVKAETSSLANTLITNIPASQAKVIINSSGWEDETIERLKIDSSGGMLYTGLEPVSLKVDGNIYLEPVNSTKSLSCQFVRQDFSRVSCTFNGINNSVVTSSSHGLSVNDNVTFNDTEGTIDTSLRSDIIYYIVSVISPTEFTISYTLNGPIIPLSGVSSGDTSFALADIHGSKPIEPIAANSPRTLVPQALESVEIGDKTFVTVSNEEDTTNILVTDIYYRAVK